MMIKKFGSSLSFGLGLFVGWFFASLLILPTEIIQLHWFLKEWPIILSSIIAGGMAVFAGWLAFREAREANRIAKIEARRLYNLKQLEALQYIIARTHSDYEKMFPNAPEITLENIDFFTTVPETEENGLVENNIYSFLDFLVKIFDEVKKTSLVSTSFDSHFEGKLTNLRDAASAKNLKNTRQGNGISIEDPEKYKFIHDAYQKAEERIQKIEEEIAEDNTFLGLQA